MKARVAMVGWDCKATGLTFFSLGNCSSHHICSTDSTPPRVDLEQRKSQLKASRTADVDFGP